MPRKRLVDDPQFFRDEHKKAEADCGRMAFQAEIDSGGDFLSAVRASELAVSKIKVLNQALRLGIAAKRDKKRCNYCPSTSARRISVHNTMVVFSYEAAELFWMNCVDSHPEHIPEGFNNWVHIHFFNSTLRFQIIEMLKNVKTYGIEVFPKMLSYMELVNADIRYSPYLKLLEDGVSPDDECSWLSGRVDALYVRFHFLMGLLKKWKSEANSFRSSLLE